MKLWKRYCSFGLAVLLGGAISANAFAQDAGNGVTILPQTSISTGKTILVQAPEQFPGAVTQAPAPPAAMPKDGAKTDKPAATPAPVEMAPAEAAAPADDDSYGPTPLLKVGILQGLLDKALGKEGDDHACIHIAGWADFDYTYRSSGSGQNNVAPVMNRFGDEALVRQLGLYIFKPTDPTCWSWGFNAIFIGGADASFLGPTAGGWANTDPRFGSQFTDLNLTAHLPVLTEGGIDIKAGRQTTCLGPMGALPWQRYFDSSDYAWYNEEEGRYTGVSAVWHISKRLDWYNGVEIGGWGVFFDDASHNVDYLTQISYWLDEDAKNTKVWTTILTGPTNLQGNGGNTTVLELGVQHNWSKCLYQIVDTQMVWSKAPVFGVTPLGYSENAYDVYTYLGYHLRKTVDLNSRFEWYDDVDGLGYAGGFGNGKQTDYFAITLGPDYHPTKCLQIRPEIRYDHASNPNFGPNYDKKDQISIAVEALIKF